MSLKELAEMLSLDRSNARRYVRKHGFAFHKRRTADSRNQLTLAVTKDEADLIVQGRQEAGFGCPDKRITKETGVFYVIRLVPELDPNRIKLGFADDLNSRLSQHRTAAPTAQVVKSWPCR